MMRWLVPGLGAFAAAFVAGHLLVLHILPERIMSAARARFEASGLTEHVWQASPRVTPETQAIVRPSPDLAYAVCLIDVSGGPVRLSVPTWAGYGSLSVFDANTDNVFVASLDSREAGSGAVEVVISGRGQSRLVPAGTTRVDLKTDEAIVLVRRLAPSDALHAEASALVARSDCAAFAD